jgi:hypothetical protein
LSVKQQAKVILVTDAEDDDSFDDAMDRDDDSIQIEN